MSGTTGLLSRPVRHPAADRGGPVPWARLSAVLVVRPDNLGDVVLATPALRALRAAAPRARIDLLASPVGSTLAPVLPYVDRFVTHSPVWQDAGGDMPVDPARELALVERLAGGGYDAMVLLTSFSQSPWPAAYLGYLAGIPVRAGLSREFGATLFFLTYPSSKAEYGGADAVIRDTAPTAGAPIVDVTARYQPAGGMSPACAACPVESTPSAPPARGCDWSDHSACGRGARRRPPCRSGAG